MRIGFIGAGVVGGSTLRWVQEHTDHECLIYDPPKGHKVLFRDVDAVFVSIPIPDSTNGQDHYELTKLIAMAKAQNPDAPIFIRSSVLPGTNDRLGTISMPEFLTERQAYDDVCRLSILCGASLPIVQRIFPEKQIYVVTNVEAELAKFAHNCSGAVKVMFWNVIKAISERIGADYENVLTGAMITGYINAPHTKVPGPDGKLGYGGKCFPTNMAALRGWLHELDLLDHAAFIGAAINLNESVRNKDEMEIRAKKFLDLVT